MEISQESKGNVIGILCYWSSIPKFVAISGPDLWEVDLFHMVCRLHSGEFDPQVGWLVTPVHRPGTSIGQ